MPRKKNKPASAKAALAAKVRETRRELARTRRERHVETLLALILSQARAITGADAGSLYLVEEIPHEVVFSDRPLEKRLRFKLTQNDSVEFPFTESVLPLATDSMAGYVALTGKVIELADAYRVPRGRPYHFNTQFDEQSGYRTHSLVTLPMKNGKGEILGALQLINCKRHTKSRLRSRERIEREVQPFPKRAVRLALSLASQAAVAYENSRLYQEIETLFEGFVKASVTAIEQRDPTTSGHSHRVSAFTVALAEAVDREPRGPYARIHFTREQMKEIRYAALLHDFGKVGVREEVLVKAKKLYPMQLALVEGRFDYIRKEIEARAERRKVELLLNNGGGGAAVQVRLVDEEMKRQLAEVDEFEALVRDANEPAVLPAGKLERIGAIVRKTYHDPRGAERPWLTPEEVRFLSIPQGTLDNTERAQIESHVVHSFNFLMQIPWTREFRTIPKIARSHHEKLNGTGYPYRLAGNEIPLEAKMMTICDIYDALAASDRPYKRAVPTPRALEILETSVRSNELDEDLFRLFLESKIYELAAKPS